MHLEERDKFFIPTTDRLYFTVKGNPRLIPSTVIPNIHINRSNCLVTQALPYSVTTKWHLVQNVSGTLSCIFLRNWFQVLLVRDLFQEMSKTWMKHTISWLKSLFFKDYIHPSRSLKLFASTISITTLIILFANYTYSYHSQMAP